MRFVCLLHESLCCIYDVVAIQSECYDAATQIAPDGANRTIAVLHFNHNISIFTFLEDMEGYLCRGEERATVATKRSEGLQPRIDYQQVRILFFLHALLC